MPAAVTVTVEVAKAAFEKTLVPGPDIWDQVPVPRLATACNG